MTRATSDRATPTRAVLTGRYDVVPPVLVDCHHVQDLRVPGAITKPPPFGQGLHEAPGGPVDDTAAVNVPSVCHADIFVEVRAALSQMLLDFVHGVK